MPRIAKQTLGSTELEDQEGLKRAFAEALLRNPSKPAEAAFKVFPGAANTGRALQAANRWPDDDEVKSIMAALVQEHGAEHFLPTREEVAREILEIARGPETETRHRLDALKLYGDFMGHTGKAADVKIDVATPMAELMSKIAANGRPKPSTSR